MRRDAASITLRQPVSTDGPAISRLIAACPPLDTNSAYCGLLQCTHFAQTCVVAERDGVVFGWVSGYRVPSAPEQFFVWQVAVAQEARGLGLAQRMIGDLLARPSAKGVTHIIATVTPDNAASWALFEGLARRWGCALSKTPHFERDAHFAGAHATEWQAKIGPLSAALTATF